MSVNQLHKVSRSVLLGEYEKETHLGTPGLGNEEEELVLRNSKSSFRYGVFISVLLLAILIIKQEEGKSVIILMFEQNWWVALFLALIPVVHIIYSLRSLKDRKPQLVINKAGIQTPEWQLGWDEIIQTKFRFRTGHVNYLVVVTENGERKVGINNLEEGRIGHFIELSKLRYALKQRNIRPEEFEFLKNHPDFYNDL